MATNINNLPTKVSETNSAENQKILDSVMNDIERKTQYSQQPPQNVAQPPNYPMQPPQMVAQYHQNPELTEKYSSQEKTYNDIMNVAKEPLLVAAIFLMLNMDFVTQLLAKYIPGMFTAQGTASNTSLIVKGLLAGGLFFVLKRMLKN